MPAGASIITRHGDPSPFFDQLGHRGVDLDAPAGSPIFSPVDGVVTDPASYGLSAGYGRAVTIRDEQGLVHILGHTAGDGPAPGTAVRRGIAVATVGAMDARAPGEASQSEHVHWEIRRGGDFGQQVDPMQFLRTGMGDMPMAGGDTQVETDNQRLLKQAEDNLKKAEARHADLESRIDSLNDAEAQEFSRLNQAKPTAAGSLSSYHAAVDKARNAVRAEGHAADLAKQRADLQREQLDAPKIVRGAGGAVSIYDPKTGELHTLQEGEASAAAKRTASQQEAGLFSAQAEHARAQAGLAGAQAEHAGTQSEEIRFRLARAQKVAQWADEARADLETALKSGDPDQMKSALDRYQEITEPDKALATLEARAEREIRASQERERTAMLVTRLGTAAEVGAAPGGPVRVGQSSGPNVPGAPDESLGLRVLHQMGLDVHPQTGMLTPRLRTPPAPAQPDQTEKPSADAALTTSQGPTTPDQETSGEQGSNLARLLNMTGMLQPQPSPEYATAV